jgi:peptidoglycan-N-acetylglucosamine deacetylase
MCSIIIVVNIFSQEPKRVLSITIDDPTVDSTAMYDWKYKDDGILNTLDKHGIKAALFVCGKRINNAAGSELIQKWDSKGHMICNHSFSHSYFHSSKIALTDYEEDFHACDSIIRRYKNYTKLFRFPYLKEGNTIEKRDGFRNFLSVLNYKNGSVTIDASDWYIDGRIRDTLKTNPNADLRAYRQYYLDHIYNRAMFYDSLAKELTERNIKHTLLLHHNLLNAMFLDDLFNMFKEKGWEIVNASDAFSDEIYNTNPDILPAGESLVWAMAKQTGKYDNILRYPAEDGEYEEEKFNTFLKSYKK